MRSKANGVVTPKGRRTRDTLVGAAREIFERDGFFDAKVTDMTRLAGVSAGTFYTYFDSKEEIFREVALLVQHDMTRRGNETDHDDNDPVRRIERANRSYLQAYRRNAPFMKALEQVLAFNSDVTGAARPRREAFGPRIERSIERLQSEGILRRDLDPAEASAALTAMVSRYAYWLYVAPAERTVNFEEAVYTVTVLWCRGLGLDVSDYVAAHARDRAGRTKVART